MTTSTTEQPNEPGRPDWDEDTVGDTQVDNGGDDPTVYYAIQDMSFDDGWVRSDDSRRLDKMR